MEKDRGPAKFMKRPVANLAPLEGREVSHPRLVSTPLHKPYTVGMYRPKRIVLRYFGLKTGKDFPHFGLESGMVFEVATSI